MLMIFGASIVLLPNFSHFLVGDILIVIATIFAPFGNFYQKRARKRVSSETMMFIRNAIVAGVTFVVAATLDLNASLTFVRGSFIFLAVNGILLFGISKILWVESIHRISVTKASALGSIYPVFALIFAWIFLKDTPTVWQLTAFVPLFIGVLLLSYKGSFKEAPLEVA
ncbi:MAG: DMT family transporter [Candidatus Liptonbacteria bacterium]|nr:DMT family transporter [Candidatus Liptonbacteria bacterium]